MDTAALLWGLFFGSFGFAYFMYGRKQKKPVPFVAGLVLMAFPYFIDNPTLLAGIGFALMAIPFFVKI
jgi:hypothetical protein